MVTPSTDADLLGLARDGAVDALFAYAATDAYAAYFWLLVAQDFGHPEAADRLGDIEECYDDFKYDDDGGERVSLHWALGEAYLRGARGLEPNVVRGIEHLAEYLDAADPGVDAPGALRDLAASLSADARSAIEACIDAQPFRAARRRVDRAQRFYELLREGAQIPSVIVEAELEGLVADAQTVVALVRARV